MGGRYTPPLLLQDILTCNLAKSTPSKGRHPQSPPTAAARWCAYLQGCTCPAHCGSNSGNRSTTEQVCRSPSFAHRDKQPTTKNALGTARLPSPAPARSAVNRMSSVTTGHQAAQCSNYLHSKIERRLPPSLHPKALFFFSTVHGALLFLRTRRKRRGGCIPNKGLHSKKKQKPPFQTGPLPSAPPRQRRRTPLPGVKPLPAPKAAEPEKPPSHWKIPHHFHGKAKKFTIPPLQCPGLRYNRALLLMHVLQGRVQVPTGGKAREPKGMIR